MLSSIEWPLEIVGGKTISHGVERDTISGQIQAIKTKFLH